MVNIVFEFSIYQGRCQAMMRALIRGKCWGVLMLMLAGSWVWGGPLEPPGPPAPTELVLPGVEPRTPLNFDTAPGDDTAILKISQPGSYFLTAPLTGVSGRSGIRIASSNVTLDLMGFTVQGTAGSFDGITTQDGGVCNNVTIRNGIVRGWGLDGIDLGSGGYGNGALLEGLHIEGNGNIGVITNFGAVVRGCTFSGNSLSGITVQTGSIVESCTARSNGQSGFFLPTRARITDCYATANGQSGFVVSSSSHVENCTSTENGTRGFSLGEAVTMKNCHAARNVTSGIYATHHCVLIGNTAIGNGDGGTGWGIYAFGNGNLFDGNVCTNNDYGIEVAGAANTLVRNRSGNNLTSNWVVVGGNSALVVNSSTGAGFNGNAGGSAIGSTDPNANFTF
jgi:hypothetical protein